MDLNQIKQLLGSLSEEQFAQIVNENKLEKIDLISLILDIYNKFLMEKDNKQQKLSFEYSQKYSILEQEFINLKDSVENKIKLVEEFYFQQFNRLRDVLNMQNALIREQKEKLYNMYFQFGQLFILIQDQEKDVLNFQSIQKEIKENQELCEIELNYQKLKESSEQLNKFRPQYENQNYMNIENFNEEQCKYVEEMIISLKNYISKQISFCKLSNVKNQSEIQVQSCFDQNLKSKEETLEKILNQLKYYRKKNQNFQLVIKQKEDQIYALKSEQEVNDNMFKTNILIIDNGDKNKQERVNQGISEFYQFTSQAQQKKMKELKNKISNHSSIFYSDVIKLMIRKPQNQCEVYEEKIDQCREQFSFIQPKNFNQLQQILEEYNVFYLQKEDQLLFEKLFGLIEQFFKVMEIEMRIIQ